MTSIILLPPKKCRILAANQYIDSHNVPVPKGAILTWNGVVLIRSNDDRDTLYQLLSINGAEIWASINDFQPI